MTVTDFYTPCTMCKEEQLVKMTDEELVAFARWTVLGGLIQNFLPNLSPEQRELFITGICPTCWEKMFDSEDDEDDEAD